MTVNGIFVKYVYRNEKTGESKFTIRDHKNVYICTGIIQCYPYGIPLKVTGEESESGDYTLLSECTVEAYGYGFCEMMTFLAGKQFTDIGQLKAKKILSGLGNNLFLYIRDSYDLEKMKEKTGVSVETLDYVFKKLHYYTEFEILYRILSTYGCGYYSVKKLYDDYGENAERIIKSNPYLLLYSNTPMNICEAIAKDYGFSECNKKRIKAVVAHAMENNRNNGNTRISFRTLCRNIKKEESCYHTEPLFIAEEILSEDYVLKEKETDIDVYKKDDYLAEKTIAESVYRLQTSAVGLNHTASCEQIEEECGVLYSVEQKEAFHAIDKTGIKIITGGPGTGKTTLLNGLLKKYERENPGKVIQLCAPTGCAARHMQESTGRMATTIHKLLDIRPYESLHSSMEKSIPADCLVVDESSMLDVSIGSILLSSVKNEALVILLGDVDQIASVGAGNVLNDIIESGHTEVYRLNTIFRQHEDNPIINNSKKIINGDPSLITNKNFYVKRFKTEDSMIEAALRIVGNCYKRNITDFKLYAPARKNKFKSGTININKRIKEIKNPYAEDSVYFGYYSFSVGDDVIFNTNNNDKGYYNGQEGVITCIQKHGETVYVTIKTEEDSVTLSGMELEDIELGYAITAHKSQGGECENAIIVIPQKPASLLKRQLLYVEVTRAKKAVCILSERDALEKAISDYMEKDRDTGLKELIKNVYESRN